MKLVLVCGLSHSGKSTLADFFEETAFATHVPLDKYFLPVPKNTTFLSWAQLPESIDWALLSHHIDRLSQGIPCYTPAYDAWDTGTRLSEGGDDHHPMSRLMNPGNRCAIAGCLSFEYQGDYQIAARIFVETKIEIIASRICGKKIARQEATKVLEENLTVNYESILGYKEVSNFVFSGDAKRSVWAKDLSILENKLN